MIKSLQQASRGELGVDLCIVGGGVAGITLALALEGSGARVLLLEGGHHHIEAEQQALYAGVVHGLPARPLTESRLRCLGGSSSRWYGRCVALEAHDFERREWVPSSGWPVSAETLAPYYRRAAAVVGLRSSRTIDPDQNRAATAELGSSRLVARWADIRMTHFGRRYGRHLARSRMITTVLGAQVLHMKRRSGSGWTLRAADLDGAQRTVTTGTVVLAAGGIENPRLMLLSGLDRSWPGNDCAIGRYFMNHAYVEGAEIGDYAPLLWRDYTIRPAKTAVAHIALPSRELARSQATGAAAYMLPRFAYQERETFGRNPMHDLWEQWRRRGLPSVVAQIPAIAGSAPEILRWLGMRTIERRKPPPTLIFRSVVEQAPNADNRVWLGDRTDRFGLALPEVSWAMRDEDSRSLHHFYKVAETEFRSLGLGRFEPTLDFDDASWQQRIYSARHHMGTTRMGADPATSVVDANCRVHGYDNLYVAGSSVFPTYGWANPTFTIIALALRLADHLAAVKPAPQKAN